MDLATFTEEIPNGKLHFFVQYNSVISDKKSYKIMRISLSSVSVMKFQRGLQGWPLVLKILASIVIFILML